VLAERSYGRRQSPRARGKRGGRGWSPRSDVGEQSDSQANEQVSKQRRMPVVAVVQTGCPFGRPGASSSLYFF
jgi:hypothetical protein